MKTKLKVLILGVSGLLFANSADAQNLDWCEDRQYCVLADLAAPGEEGTIYLYERTSTGGYNQRGTCRASGGVAQHSDGAPSLRTPPGVYDVIDTADRLEYNGRLINMYDPTYFLDPDPTNARTTNRLAIHTGHVAGQNSHGCIRTTTNCADAIRNAADNSDYDMKIKVTY